MTLDLYIALKRLRTEMWRTFPPLVFIRWLFHEHPRMVVPFGVAVAAVGSAPALWETFS